MYVCVSALADLDRAFAESRKKCEWVSPACFSALVLCQVILCFRDQVLGNTWATQSYSMSSDLGLSVQAFYPPHNSAVQLFLFPLLTYALESVSLFEQCG